MAGFLGRMGDGLRNLVSGLGTDRDKAAAAEYTSTVLTDDQIVYAYQTSSLVRRMIDLPAEDSTREWREWQATADEIDAIEAEEKRLRLKDKVLEARKLCRLIGGGAIYIGARRGDSAEPFEPESVGKGGIEYLTVLSPYDLSGHDIERDPASRYFGQPRAWRLNLAGENMLEVHPSRLVLFRGVRVPLRHLAMTGRHGWGDSVLNGMLGSAQRVETAAMNANSLLYEAKVDVVKIPDLMSNLQVQGDEYTNRLLRRLTLAATGKGINGMLMLDKEEEYESKSASFGGLDAMLDRFMQLASADSGIPMTLLFGMSPAGMNATGESDIRNYYDRVAVEQSSYIEPEMSLLDDGLIVSALGRRPPEVHYNWRPLWQPTAAERAEIGDKLTSAAERLARIEGAVPVEAVGKAAVNALTEAGVFPGLEGYVDEFYAENPNPDEDGATEPGAAEPGRPQLRVVNGQLVDAAPRTLYVRRDVLNAAEIKRWAREQGFPSSVDDMHVTIAFSRKPVDWMAVGDSYAENVEVNAGGARLMERFGETGDAIVLLFNSSELAWRHHEIREAGASWDWPDYQPHITVSYAGEAVDLEQVEPYRGRIILGPERFEEVDDDWKAKVGES